MSIEYRFKASADRVFGLLTHADFLVDRCLALCELSAECTIEDDDDEVIITLTREVERHRTTANTIPSNDVGAS